MDFTILVLHEILKRGFWRLIHKEEYSSLAEARRREKQIKSYKGGNAFKKLIESNARVVQG
ncbi:MAG: hypothetical protein HYT83_03090 [Candidatus Levybacteria bacterium]|nr:hypothetical protein [Candidatus Levybacteria bacterium]